jgi:hypothetical protein
LIDNHGWADLRVSNALTLTPNSVDKNFIILLYSLTLIALFSVAYKFYDEKFSSIQSDYIKGDTDVVYSLSKTLEPKTPKIFMMTDEIGLTFTQFYTDLFH